MTLKDLGFTDELELYKNDQHLDSFACGRVVSEHKDRYILQSDEGEFTAELLGNLRFSAENRRDLPAVGDWVAYSEYDEGKALIHAIYPRSSIIERQAIGSVPDKQIIATNIDVAIIVQAVDRDFNLNRLERYLAICNASKVEPLIVLSKIDLVDTPALQELLEVIVKRIPDVQVITLSNLTSGASQLAPHIEAGKTYCLMGSSGVGKSTLLNHLAGREIMETRAISDSVNKGRHTTSHRSMVLLPEGGIVIDNPGMRSVGITESSDGVNITFEDILRIAQDCKFKDCTHIQEKGCAVIAAIEEGRLDEAVYTNFQKMKREQEHFESSIQDRRKKDKQFGKMIKSVKKQRKIDKY